MILFVETPFSIGDNVIRRGSCVDYPGKIIDIELKRNGSDYAVLCLIELENRERRWVHESDLALEDVAE